MSEYRPSFYFWETVELARKLLVTGFVLIIPEDFHFLRLQVALIVSLGFLVLHLKAFRFSDSARRWRHPDALPNAPSERDLYYLMLERFARPS